MKNNPQVWSRSRVTPLQSKVLAFVKDHPGCSSADVHRFEKGGRRRKSWPHGATYARVSRMIKRGLLKVGPYQGPVRGSAIGLYVAGAEVPRATVYVTPYPGEWVPA
jgi:hypothetical protein